MSRTRLCIPEGLCTRYDGLSATGGDGCNGGANGAFSEIPWCCYSKSLKIASAVQEHVEVSPKRVSHRQTSLTFSIHSAFASATCIPSSLHDPAASSSNFLHRSCFFARVRIEFILERVLGSCS